ncbi:hypothetical protein NDU88_009898 [Pleurodeles waltl]|uniref:Uncharacterized protein n=1 Tax=Pleurodeles waltl TaxID=8319 RepID=A0AAV7QWC5_PLEWA|nr:hypothetical protein NDU88_009898 [Pleurodeles waltl]
MRRGVRVCFRTRTNPKWCCRASEASAVSDPAPEVRPPLFFFRAVFNHCLGLQRRPTRHRALGLLGPDGDDDHWAARAGKEAGLTLRGRTRRASSSDCRVPAWSLILLRWSLQHGTRAMCRSRFFFLLSAPLVCLYVFSATREF